MSPRARPHDANVTAWTLHLIAFRMSVTVSAASGSADNSVAIWSIENGSCLAQLNGHLSTVYAIAILPSGALTTQATSTAALETPA